MLTVLAAIVVLAALGALAAILRVLWRGSAEERRERLAQTHLCPHCDYDLSSTSLWPDTRREDPTPRCPECGRVITGISGIDFPDRLPTAKKKEGRPPA
jgi:hypothetical protein